MKMCQRRAVSCCTWGVFFGRHCVGRTADRSADKLNFATPAAAYRRSCSAVGGHRKRWGLVAISPARAKVEISKLCTCGIAATALRWSAEETP